MKPFDAALASPFRITWLHPLDEVERDDYSRAVAEKAEAILRSARFIEEQRATGPSDIEIRVWVEAANAPGCVSVTWEPGAGAFGFHLLDETLRERLACIVFDALPCVDAEDSAGQFDLILQAALDATLPDGPQRGPAPATESQATLVLPSDPNEFDPGIAR